ncbi:MAG: hypothetical protein ACOH10_13795, partial [Rhodoglobus sp.]
AFGLIGRRDKLQPQQLLLADVLNAGNKFNGVLMPRRSTKTSTLIAWAIGRCLAREDYLIAYTSMTTGKKARDRFLKEVVPRLIRAYPDEATRPFKIRTAAGQERLVFDNGSIFQINAPLGDDFRSDAYDVIILDESGEPEPEKAEDVLGAALPTMDTRPGAMIVKAGTAGEFQEGNLLWEELELGRAEKPRHGILDYSVPATVKLSALDEWDDVKPLVLASHPGTIKDGLSPIANVQDNFELFTPARFSREYLGMFGKAGGSSFMDSDAWLAMADGDAMPKPPKVFRLAYSVHPLQTSASIVAVWRDKKNRVHVGVIASQPGVAWLVPEMQRLAKKYNVPFAFDQGTTWNANEADKVARIRPASNRPKLDPMTWAAVSTAAVAMLEQIEAGNITHYGHEGLNTAVRVAVKRMGGKDSKRWNFGRSKEADDITTLEAAALALRALDNMPAPTPKLGIISASSEG